MKPLPDETDIVAALANLNAECDALEKALSAAGKPFPSRPKLPDNDLLHATELMAAHNATLKVRASLAGIKLSESPRPGASGHSSSKSQGGPAPGANSTATQRVLAAKGVKSLDELAGVKPEQPALSERQRAELERMLDTATGITRQAILAKLGRTDQ